MQFLKTAGFEHMTFQQLNALQNQSVPTVELSSSTDAYQPAFNKVNISAMFLAYVILREGDWDDSRCLISFDLLFGQIDYDTTRNISSRIGGLRKITDGLGLKPVMEIARVQGERYALVHRYSYEPLLDFFNRNDHKLDLYAEDFGETMDFDVIQSPPDL